MEATATVIKVLHLTEDPNDDYLLMQELAEAGFDTQVVLVAARDELLAAVAQQRFDVLVVDLPLSNDVRPELFDELALLAPQLAPVFRWGTCGERSVESSSQQLGRCIGEVLKCQMDRPQDVTERKAMVAELVRHQNVQLELAREDLWDFKAALHKVTQSMAELLQVERVSIWEVDEQGQLHCLELFVRSQQLHSRGPELPPCPSLSASLQRSLTVATADARSDPRMRELVEDYLSPLGILGVLDAPIRRRGRVVGVVCHEHVGTAPRHWSLLDQCAAAKAASLVGRALEVRDRRAAEARAEQLRRFEAVAAVAKGVAHDMNNLLTVLLGNLMLLEDGGFGGSQRESVEAARLTVDGIASLVRDLARIGQPEVLRLRSLELGGWLQQQQRLLQGLVLAPARLIVTLPSAPIVVEADEAALSRVLLNLVKNAWESLHEGGQVQVRLEVVGGHAVLMVEDDGVGIDERSQQHLFEPYFTRHAVSGAKDRSRGLGLPTALGIVHQHGGHIDVTSECGYGSCFSVHLPLQQAGSGPQPATSPRGVGRAQ